MGREKGGGEGKRRKEEGGRRKKEEKGGRRRREEEGKRRRKKKKGGGRREEEEKKGGGKREEEKEKEERRREEEGRRKKEEEKGGGKREEEKEEGGGKRKEKEGGEGRRKDEDKGEEEGRRNINQASFSTFSQASCHIIQTTVKLEGIEAEKDQTLQEVREEPGSSRRVTQSSSRPEGRTLLGNQKDRDNCPVSKEIAAPILDGQSPFRSPGRALQKTRLSLKDRQQAISPKKSERREASRQER
ncbi:hypothetical protein L345_13034, partial [Ophiophagus hannah]